MDARDERILITGTGAMACLFAARLSAAAIPVTLAGTWKEGLQAIRQRGVRLVEGDTEKAYRVEVTTEPGCRGFMNALVLVKSWQTDRAAAQLQSCLAPQGLALTLQNGLGNAETLANTLGKERVALGTTTAGATLLAPGKVQAGGNGSVTLGSHPRLEGLADLFQAAGFNVQIVPDARALLWGKLVINAAINPITALLRIPNGELLERPEARELMQAAALEAAAVARTRGIELPYPDPVEAAENVARRTAANLSSMLQDVMRCAPTEIDAICGAIVREGEQAGVDTPVNRTLWKLVKGFEPA
jgi:2-dehydropantoate 2-reductase